MIQPVVLAEGGNHFGRLTASPSDCGPSFQTTCPQTRAEMWMDGLPDVMGETRTYTASIRISSSNPGGRDNLLWQIFEGDYPVSACGIWIGTQNGRVYLANQVRPIPQTSQTVFLWPIASDSIAQVVELGAIVYDKWITYTVIVVLSTDAATGHVTVLKNGVQMGTITGQPPKYYKNHTDIYYLDVVDLNVTLGIADINNAQQATGPPAAPTRMDEN